MKKFGKFLFGTITLASIAAGAYYVYKNFIKNDSSDDFDDFEDDFEDFDTDEDEEDADETRGYVSINLSSEELKDESNTANENIASEAPAEKAGAEQ